MRVPFVQADNKSYLVHVAIFSLIYTTYGQHICPILESNSFLAVLAPCAVALLSLALVRSFLMNKFAIFATDVNLRWSFWCDFALFMVAGALVSTFSGMYFQVPTENILKVSVSFVALGYYVSLDLSLRREHRMAQRIISGDAEFPKNGKSMPVTQKFAIFSIINLVLLATVCLLVVYKDLIYLGHEGITDKLILVVLMETSFVLMVLGGYTVNAIKQYSKNLKLSLETEHKTLIAVSSGDLQNRAAVLSRDEFGEVAALTNQMIEKLEASIQNQAKTQNAFLVSLVSLAAKRDNETGMHLRRTQMYIAELADTLRQSPTYSSMISEDCVDLYYQAAPLHDIGKVGIPDSILQKPGPLTDDEYEIMKTHTTIGAAALEDAAKQLEDSQLINIAREIVISHHERWDGKGYPHGLKGADIPLSGRMMSVADVYDALRSKRVYKPAMSHEKAVAIIEEGRGTQFDPDVVDAFLVCADKFEVIGAAYQDKSCDEASENSNEAGVQTPSSVAVA